MVSCPNYLFETIAWVAIAGMTRSLAAVLFLVVATAQMYLWALKKHRQYQREFPEYPKTRKAIFPFVVAALISMEQIEQAVRCALDPESTPDVKAQVKKSPDGWQVCLQLFTKVPERGSETRLFALQAIEAMIADAGTRGDASGAAAKLDTARKILL
ncbi:3-oxo-5a-steroid 4- dehydrogenase, partial [Coemansia sp. RSA 2706]